MHSEHDRYFGDKARELDVTTLKAFGINLVSRYGKANELSEMLRFAEMLSFQKLHPFVLEVFYDGHNGSGASFTLAPDVIEGGLVWRAIEHAAHECITAYIWSDIQCYARWAEHEDSELEAIPGNETTH